MRIPSLLARLAVALCLLLSQQGLIAHAVTHTLKEAQRDSTPDKTRVCDVCVLSAQIKDALLSQARLVIEPMPQPRIETTPCTARDPSPTRPYRSRAPPTLS